MIDRCHCRPEAHATHFVAVTGGPSAGKTALLEVVRRQFCEHVMVLPESASIIFGGGFPRHPDLACRAASQRAIYRVQCELERWAHEAGRHTLVLCDRGTLDGLAYWPGPADGFFADVHTTRGAELARYQAVLHLRTPPPEAYDRSNPLRVESPDEALTLDDKILSVWADHPRRTIIDSAPTFLAKLHASMDAIRDLLPDECQAWAGAHAGA